MKSIQNKQRKHTWIPKLIAPRESQWSILGKFVAWNALTSRQLNQLVSSLKCSYNPINLATTQFLDVNKFYSLTGVTYQQIQESLPAHYTPEGWGSTLICNTLRYCPQCIRGGYHSAIYQVGLITSCPIHEVPLIDVCDQCGSKIEVTTSRSNLNTAYRCGSCLNVFCDITMVGKLVQRQQVCNRIVEKVGAELEELMDETRGRRVYWGKGQSMVESAQLTYSCYAECLQEIKKYSGNIPIKEAVNIGRHLDWDLTRVKPLITLWPIYKTLRRYIRRKILNKHRKCAQILFSLGEAYEGLSLERPLMCAISHAYIMWRMYWEQHASFASMNLDQQSSIEWSFAEIMTDEEAIHVFANDCLASFYKLYEQASRMEQHKCFKLLTRREVQSLKHEDMFLENWAISEIPKQKDENISRVFTWRQFDEIKPDRFSKKHYKAIAKKKIKMHEAIERKRN